MELVPLSKKFSREFFAEEIFTNRGSKIAKFAEEIFVNLG